LCALFSRRVRVRPSSASLGVDGASLAISASQRQIHLMLRQLHTRLVAPTRMWRSLSAAAGGDKRVEAFQAPNFLTEGTRPLFDTDHDQFRVSHPFALELRGVQLAGDGRLSGTPSTSVLDCDCGCGAAREGRRPGEPRQLPLVHLHLQSLARNFFKTSVVPFHDAWETQGYVPRELWQEAGKNGLLGVTVPEKYGGVGADVLWSAIVWEEQGYSLCTGPGFALHSEIVIPYILHYGSEEQVTRPCVVHAALTCVDSLAGGRCAVAGVRRSCDCCRSSSAATSSLLLR
jgi:hypothetical protein